MLFSLPYHFKEDICEIIGNTHVYCSKMPKDVEETEEEDDNEMEFQERDPIAPNVGTRVKRGPDWMWKNQDGRGAGTVVGHGTRSIFIIYISLFLILIIDIHKGVPW